jgi:hypothetical protein
MADESLLVGPDSELVETLANSKQLTPQQLGACVITVSRLFKALDEVAEKMYRPKTRPPPEVVVFCQLLKEVLTRQINEER